MDHIHDQVFKLDGKVDKLEIKVDINHAIVVGLRPVLEGFVVTMHEGACETGSQIPTA